MTATRRTILAGIGAAAALPAFPAFAKMPIDAAQVAGAYRTKVGDIEITALLDGYLDFELKLFPRSDPAQFNELVARSVHAKPLRGAVNAFLVNTGDKLILVDAGGPKAFFPGMGALHAQLKAAGVMPEAVDAVLFTHLHPDHIAGILIDGKVAFPNAELIAPEVDWKFWMSPETLAGAPDGFKPFVQFAQSTVAPYGKKYTLHKGEAEIAKGITAVPEYGHTPGHTGYRVASGKEQILICGDICVGSELHFQHPEWSIAFDADQDAAIATRKKIFDMVSADKIPLLGAHLPFPGQGYVVKAGTAYSYVPAQWMPVL